MHLIGSFLTWLMPTLTAWAVSFFTRKITVATTTIMSFILITAAFVVCIKQAVTYILTLAILPTWLSAGLGMFIPMNFSVVLSSILASQSCRWAYDKAREKIQMLNSAT